MRHLIAGLLAAGAMMAQSPQMVWEGEVDGICVLYARANRIDAQIKQGQPVQRQRFRFHDRLPDSRQDVRLVVRDGRGSVRITGQPRLDNNYTLAVTIEDRQGGRAFYSLEFYWDAHRGGNFDPSPPQRRYNYPGDSRPSGAPGGSERLNWSGRVDGEVIVECRRDYCQAQATRGAAVTRERSSNTRPLPRREVQVGLADTQGRGEMRLIEQPSERNDYTARVLIRDGQGGAGEYSFALVFTPIGRNEPEHLYTTRGLVWHGHVDDRVRVIVEGGRCWSEVVRGGAVTGERAVFDRPLPRGALSPAVKRLRGRGHVEIVEFPSNRNGFRLVFEITDTDGGADNYEIEVGW